jgi:hypothetical protein
MKGFVIGSVSGIPADGNKNKVHSFVGLSAIHDALL